MLLKTSVIGLAAARLTPSLRLPDSLMARSSQVKIGVTDWNLKQEGKLEAERLPLSDKTLQQLYVQKSENHKLPIASTCLNLLHENVLKLDQLAQRWVADSIPITKNVGAKVILLQFFLERFAEDSAGNGLFGGLHQGGGTGKLKSSGRFGYREHRLG
jgi:L-ribulose-5-phosphate 3-epimerase